MGSTRLDHGTSCTSVLDLGVLAAVFGKSHRGKPEHVCHTPHDKSSGGLGDTSPMHLEGFALVAVSIKPHGKSCFGKGSGTRSRCIWRGSPWVRSILHVTYIHEVARSTHRSVFDRAVHFKFCVMQGLGLRKAIT
jgi:hypothetical protein